MDKRKVILLFENEPPSHLCETLTSHNWIVCSADSRTKANNSFKNHQFLVGLAFIEENSSPKYLTHLEEFFNCYSGTQWIILISPAQRDVFSAISYHGQLIRDYCFDFHTLPIQYEQLLFTLGHAYGMAEITINPYDKISQFHSYNNIVGKSPSMLKIFDQIQKISQTDQLLLIEGETGTGKRLIAKAVHEASDRSNKPFVELNCGEFDEDHIITELFGCEKKANPGLRQSKKGLLESVKGGTLFLDYINEFPASKQGYLLKFLENQTFKRLGGEEKIKVDARIIASSHINLTNAVVKHNFRQDLFFRLRVHRIFVPPLRDREEDKELLAWYFFNLLSNNLTQKTKGFSINALNVMHLYDWPGNIRELQNCVQHAITVSTNRLLTPEDLGLERRSNKRSLKTLEEYRSHADREAITSALKCSHYNITQAAKLLDVSRVTLYGLIEKYKLRDRIQNS